MNNSIKNNNMTKTLGTWQVMVSGVALVVAASTLVSDFTGFFTLGWEFAIALGMGFIINLLLGLSVADLSVTYPKSGAVYDYAQAIFSGNRGRFAGVFLGLTFFGMLILAFAGETAAGAYGLKALSHLTWDIRVFIVLMSLTAVVPNLLGIRTATWISAGLLVLMLGIRWLFGLSGFFGWGATGPWTAENLCPETFTGWFGDGGIITSGLALGIWSFVGIEFACSLAEEVRQPVKAMPHGIVLGLLIILGTSLVMGLGITGTAPLSFWQGASLSGPEADAPQLMVGRIMFGETGYMLMALSSVAATLGSLVVAFAAIPRLLFSMARDNVYFGPLSKPFARLHPRFGTPVAAILFTCLSSLIPAFYNAAVIDWVFSAAYIWILLYALFHLLALINHHRTDTITKVFKGRWFSVVCVAGIVLTIVGLYFAFAGAHLFYGGRAMIVVAVALLITTISILPENRKVKQQVILQLDISELDINEELFQRSN